MKIFSGIFGFLSLAVTLCFVLSNRQDVTLFMWPLEGSRLVPLFVIGLIPLAFGLIVGGVWGWLTGLPHRVHARHLKKELEALNGKISELQKASIVQQAQAKKKRSLFSFLHK